MSSNGSILQDLEILESDAEEAVNDVDFRSPRRKWVGRHENLQQFYNENLKRPRETGISWLHGGPI